ncbi:MAG: DUF333 domain-containing protein, partial [Candidatus Aenigmarchaeota archaeon]|nr:DUF333 domain-containing protein [Candidatus Aenigmarchaeota archaeon]
MFFIVISSVAFAIPNPAAVYCMELGYEYKTIKTDIGKKGVCVFPDSMECEAWDFYRGDCGQIYSPDAKKDEILSVKKLTSKVSIENKNIPQKTKSLLKSYPSSLDWRNKDGQNWITSIKDQGGCGACWAFSTTGVVESKININLNDPNFDKDLSEQYLVSCDSANDGCSGGQESLALDYYKNYGVPDEGCFPYTATNNTCSNRCSDWADRLVKIKNYAKISETVAAIKQMMFEYGPITAYMDIYSDFLTYTGGIYYHTTLEYVGLHSVVLVGYNDAEQYWIGKNSWGNGWGEGGYFRVHYNETSFQWDPVYYNGVIFLDDSYYVTNTDIDNDGVSDSIDVCPTTYGTWCNGCPEPSCGICQYSYCPDSLEPYCEFSSTSTLCDSNFQCSIGVGDNNYGIDGEYSCQGYCDGSGSCDYADNCAYSTDCDIDDDDDGVLDENDLCPDTPLGESIDSNGCSQSQV